MVVEEISKIGEISSVGDFLDFKLSIKTIIIGIILYAIGVVFVVVFIFGGVQNTINYVTNILETTRKSIIIIKDKKSTNEEEKEKETEISTKNKD